MKITSLILLIVLGISCGGVTLDKKQSPVKRETSHSPATQNTEKLVHLKILEQKYLQEENHMKLAITRGMIMETEAENEVSGTLPQVTDLKKLRKNQAFLSLEMTIEHLSHREQFKLGTRHSAFHKRL